MIVGFIVGIVMIVAVGIWYIYYGDDDDAV